MNKALEQFPHLLAPLKIGNVVYRNHIFAGPSGFTESARNNQIVEKEGIYLYRKALGGAAAITVSETSADPWDRGDPYWPRSVQNPGAHNYIRASDMITRAGAVPSLEINFEGMLKSFRGLDAVEAIGPSDIEHFDGYTHSSPRPVRVRAMTEEEIWAVIKEFGKEALAAKRVGFRMVKVHAAHGWGLHQFFSPMLNKRTDKWGGSIENRCRFAVEVVDEIHRVCGKNFPVEIRISGEEVIPGGFGPEESCRIAQQLDGHADIIHFSTGMDFDDAQSASRTELSMFYPFGYNAKRCAAKAKKVVKHSLIGAVGGISDPYEMERMLADGECDIIYLVRQLICDPDLPNKVANGKADYVRKCMRCLHCYSYTMPNGDLRCAINPKVGREPEMFYSLPPVHKKKVLVIGGGIAGMQAALTAAEEGHEVVLCEKTNELGGNILCEKDVPFKQRLHEYIELQKKLLAESSVDVRMETEVTPEFVEELAPDAVIAALGSTPAVPPVKGIDNPKVIQAVEVYKDPSLAKGKTVILGAGLVGSELALYLDDLGNRPEVVEMASDITDGGNLHQKYAIIDMMKQKNMEFRFNTKALEINEKGVLCEHNGEQMLIEADTVVVATGMIPRQDEALRFAGTAPSFSMVGDCCFVANIANATGTAFSAAHYLGRYGE